MTYNNVRLINIKMNKYFNKVINFKYQNVDENSKHILLCGDKNYVKYVGVTLTSTVISFPDGKLNFHIFVDDINEIDLQKLQQTADKYQININVYFINLNIIDKFSTDMAGNDHISVAAYFRFIAFGALQDICDKVLYLDSDILVRGDIGCFWNTDLGDKIAVVIADAHGKKQINRVGVDKYFNSGVMFVDINKWNENSYSELCIRKASETVWRFLDQDVLNIVLDKKFVCLPKEYNFQYSLSRLIDNSAKPNEEKLSVSILIVHFIGASKPWHSWTQCFSAVEQYNKIKEKSFWNDNGIVFPDEMKGERYKYMHKSAIICKKNANYFEMIRWYVKYSLEKIKYHLYK